MGENVVISVVWFLVGFVLAYVFTHYGLDVPDKLALATAWICGTIWQQASP